MNNKKLCADWIRPFVSFLVLLSFGLTLIPASRPVRAQRTVTVTADQPNVWTLEQAHYLLAQMHRRNLDLKAKPLGELDPNEINGINIDILKSILELGATYNQADQLNNNLTRQDLNFNTARRQQLNAEVDNLSKEKLELTRVIARLKREKEVAESESEKNKLEAQIQENLEIKDEVEAQVEEKRQQLERLSGSSGNLIATQGGASFDASKFPSGLLDDSVKSKLGEALSGLVANPKLNSSLQLDKFVQLQYEIISKQLTLLRDEVGPGERLLFLEMPQSINANYDKSDDMWAQSRWRINGFTRCTVAINGKQVPCHRILYPAGVRKERNRYPRTTLDIFESVRQQNCVAKEIEEMKFTLADIQDPRGLAIRFVERKKDERLQFLVKYNVVEPSDEAGFASSVVEWRDAEVDLRNALNEQNQCTDLTCRQQTSTTVDERRRELDRRWSAISNPPGEMLAKIVKTFNAAIEDVDAQLNSAPLNMLKLPARTRYLSGIRASDGITKALLNRLYIEDAFSDELYQLGEEDLPSCYFPMDNERSVGSDATPDLNGKSTNRDTTSGGVSGPYFDNRAIRTVEIIPRQSSFNVNDIRIRNRSSALNFIVSTLFGLGGSFNYQQQRERYSQFVQQELYSSGFGKGAREFGWTFTSMPGTDRLLSGTRNTYAVVVVPQEATSISVESIGCSFDRTARQPENFATAVSMSPKECSNHQSFVIPIPGGGFGANNDFYVSGLRYKPVPKGKRIVISIYGLNFPSQIGMMINGVALLPAIGVAQNFVRDDSKTGETVSSEYKSEKVKGSFERVDSNQIVAVFEMLDGDVGTPVVTLVSPGKAVDLNGLSLYINDRWNIKLENAEWMFGIKTQDGFRAENAQVFVSKTTTTGEPTELTALITGKSLDGISDAFVNGLDPVGCVDGSFAPGCTTRGSRYYWASGNVYQMKFPPPNDDKIQIVLVRKNDVIRIEALDNPAKKEKQKVLPALKPSDLSFSIKNLTPIYADDKKTKILFVLVEIEGNGFSSVLESSLGQLDIVDGSRAFLTIPDPKPAQSIRLTDPKRNIYATGVIEVSRLYKPAPTPAPSPTPTPSP